MRSAALLVLLLLTGCGTSSSPGTPVIDSISGEQVGTMAERQLEADHPGMAPGDLTCPDLEFEVGRAVRCERIAELSGGRRIRVLGTVTVTSTEGGGRLHVKLDDDVAEFGVTGDALEADLRGRIAATFTVRPDEVRCPYLTGGPGSSVRCRVTVGEETLVVVVVVTGRDPADNLTRYRFDWHLVPPGVQRRLAFVAPTPPAVMGLSRDHRSRTAA